MEWEFFARNGKNDENDSVVSQSGIWRVINTAQQVREEGQIGEFYF